MQPSAGRVCENCGTALVGDFCHRCGQENRVFLKNFFSLAGEVFSEIVNWDSRVARTLPPLLCKPGYLSREYVSGRRARYVQPTRLYLFVSVLFFLVIALVTQFETGSVEAGLFEQQESAENATAPGAIRPFSERNNLNLPFLAPETEAEFKRRIDRVAGNPELLVSQMRTLAPAMMFILLPLFAFILKILYLFKRRYYVEHLVLALHTHSFMFTMFMLIVGLSAVPVPAAVEAWLFAALVVWIPVYLFIAQKRFYGQGWFMTTVKFLATGIAYFTMMLGCSIGLVIASIMTA